MRTGHIGHLGDTYYIGTLKTHLPPGVYRQYCKVAFSKLYGSIKELLVDLDEWMRELGEERIP